MKSKLLRKTLGAVAVTSLIASGVAQAGLHIEDNWNLNLELANGGMVDTTNNGTADTALADLKNSTGIDHLNMVGFSTIRQNVLNGSSLGQQFSDSGVFQFTNFSPEGGGFVENLDLGNAGALIGVFSNLTGTLLNPSGNIVFDTGALQLGTIDLMLDFDGNVTTTFDRFSLASYALIAPSGGSDLDFFGGAGANATLDLSLKITRGIDGLFTDENDVEYGDDTIHTVNTDALLDPNFGGGTGIDNTGVINGNGVSIIHTQNNGQYNLTTEVPEPGSLALFTLGLMGLASLKRKFS